MINAMEICINGEIWRTVVTAADRESPISTLKLYRGHWPDTRERTLMRVDVLRVNWRGVKSFLHWVSGKEQRWALAAYKALRRQRDACQRRTWEETMPRAVVKWALSEISRRVEMDELDFADSYRCGRVGKTSSMRRFRAYRSCCGSAEWSAVCPEDGQRYILGLNFGH